MDGKDDRTRTGRDAGAHGRKAPQLVEPARPHGRLNPAYRTAAAMVLPFVTSTTRHEWSGWENLPDEGGFVAAPNHISYFDPFAIAHYLYASGCEPYFLGKEEVFRIPVFGRLLVASGQVPVYRKTGRAADAYRAAVEGVEHGKCIVVFPEGTLTRDPRPVADGGQDRSGPDRATDPEAGRAHRALGCAGGDPARTARGFISSPATPCGSPPALRSTSVTSTTGRSTRPR